MLDGNRVMYSERRVYGTGLTKRPWVTGYNLQGDGCHNTTAKLPSSVWNVRSSVQLECGPEAYLNNCQLNPNTSRNWGRKLKN